MGDRGARSGASLAALGMTNALADPTLVVRDGNGALLMGRQRLAENPEQMAS